jgi:signal transduction histidine kinase
MTTESLPTDFAPAKRSPSEKIAHDAALFNSEIFFKTIVDFSPNIVVILDQNRQIVFANKTLLDMIQVDNPLTVLGQRPGEAINCKHASESEEKCGTTKFCRYCGAANAILKSQAGEYAIEECRILVGGNGAESALDLRVWTNPFVHHGERFTCFIALNIADEKQRHFMERIFLHDIMNTASALLGFSEIIVGGDVDEEMGKNFMQRIALLAGRIIDEINAHRQLLAAEHNELVVTKKELDSLAFIKGIYDAYNRPDMLNNRRLQIDEAAQATSFVSDETLLSRVVGNMVKNAIEGSIPGETVIIGCFVADGSIHFQVNNPTYMPENIRLQVFNRSFSTKGVGRGLGTYSMKYLTEKYLNGRIIFTSSEKEGTTFTATYPLGLSSSNASTTN